MSTNSQNNTDNQEIDLSNVSKSIANVLENISSLIFQGILFIKKRILVISILFILGIGLGFYLDRTNTDYDHEIIVTPNFGSNDFLYSKVELLNSKIKEKDTLVLTKMGFKNIDKIGTIEVEPIVDIYKFIKNNAENFELIKLMAEDGDLKKIVEDKITSKNYPFHALKVSTSKRVTEDGFTKPLLNYLNDSEYFKRIQKVYITNAEIKMRENDSIIKQIDAFLNTFKSNSTSGSKSNSLVYYNENTQLNDIIKTKDLLILEQGSHRVEKIINEKIIKDISVTTNIKNTKSLNGKMKLVLPLVFVFMYVFCYLFAAFYKREQKKLNVQ